MTPPQNPHSDKPPVGGVITYNCDHCGHTIQPPECNHCAIDEERLFKRFEDIIHTVIKQELKVLGISKRWHTQAKITEDPHFWKRAEALTRQVIATNGYATSSNIKTKPELAKHFSHPTQAKRLFDRLACHPELILFKLDPHASRGTNYLARLENYETVKAMLLKRQKIVRTHR